MSAEPGSVHWHVFRRPLCNRLARLARDPQKVTCPKCRRGWEIFSERKSANPLASVKPKE